MFHITTLFVLFLSKLAKRPANVDRVGPVLAKSKQINKTSVGSIANSQLERSTGDSHE